MHIICAVHSFHGLLAITQTNPTVKVQDWGQILHKMAVIHRQDESWKVVQQPATVEVTAMHSPEHGASSCQR